MATAQRDYYDILGVPRTAEQDDIKKAFRRLARQFHPDLHSGSRKSDMERKFKELNEAYETLGDPERRKKYDRYGHQWAQAEAFERARQQAGAKGSADGSAWTETFGAGGPDFSDVFETIVLFFLVLIEDFAAWTFHYHVDVVVSTGYYLFSIF